jgi:hypothetical protein
MQTMTEGREGISLTQAMALKFTLVARQLSLVAAVLSIAALVAGTAVISYAGPLPDTVVVSNFGSLFEGSFETFAAGSVSSSKPEFFVSGSNTLLGDGNGAAGDAQSSLDGDIAVAVPFGIAGVFPNGFVETYPFGANGNSSAEQIIASPAGFPDLTGISLGQGVAFENPFDGVHPFGDDILAVANYTPGVIEPDLGVPGLGLCLPNAPGFSLGTITEYDKTFLIPGVNDTPPMNNSPVNFGTQNATIGGCDTYLLGPVGAAFDNSGDLFVVNQIGLYITAYAPGASGNAVPIALVGTGALVNPGYVAVASGPFVDDFPFPQDIIYVTDAGDNSIKVFAPFDPPTCFTPALPFGCFGTQLGTIQGNKTKLRPPGFKAGAVGPLGIALDANGENLYVVNNGRNSLSVFNALATGNISPKLIIKGKSPKMNFPVGVTLPQFPPPAD